tara:strand:- start:88 stop:603 length:516 start_codon:yes stop_codon:yes gene_type:complete
MALREVLTWPNPRLREVAQPVSKVNDEVKALVRDLFDTMYDEGGVGLAATQIGVPLRVVVMDCGMEEKRPIALINAEIVAREGTILWQEGCLSVPGVTAEVERSAHINVHYLDATGQPQALEADGLLAVCVQHELDHLDGHLYFDRLAEFERKATLIAYEDAAIESNEASS